jgi:hypothetical protein
VSINGYFVEIKPTLLGRIQENPTLIETVALRQLDLQGLSTGDIEAIIGAWSPERQQYVRAVLSVDVNAIVAALKTMLPGKQRQTMQAHYLSMTTEQLSKEAADLRSRLLAQPTISGAQKKSKGLGKQGVDIGARICVYKAWGGLHYLLSKTMPLEEESFALAILGGREIGNDIGYGPARYLEESQVKRVAAALPTVTLEILRQGYDASAMDKAGIYPGRWRDAHDSESVDWLFHAFEVLLMFYKTAAGRSNAVVKYLI